MNAARLPQELIDAILDEFDTSPLAKPWNVRGSAELKESQKAVKSCALVARTFVRPSQMKLFSAVDLRTNYTVSPDSQTPRFSKLISSSPHIAAYVKTLLLSYRPGRSKTVDHILSSLGKLTSLLLHPWSGKLWSLPSFPLSFRDSFAPALSLSSLQFIEIQRHRFDSALDLQALLCNSMSLKSLTLRAITFANLTPLEPPVAGLPRIVLNSLRLIELKHVDVEELVKHFATVDITHLHSLHLDDCSLTNIVRANPSIREIKIGISVTDLTTEPLETLLPERNYLRTIHLEAYSPSAILSMIRQLGNLSKLDALKIVTIKIMLDDDCISWQHQDWFLIDTFFGQLLGVELEEVNVSCVWFQDQTAAEGFRKYLPALDKKGILRVSLVDCHWNFSS